MSGSGTPRSLDADGRLYTDNLRTARQADEYVLDGRPAVLEPRFTVHGFRYAEVTGYPGEPGPGDVVARVAHSDIPATGKWESDQAWLDQLARNVDWGQRGNFISVPTDCPQRDERLGWLGDAQIFARTACYNRDVAAFFAKWLDDVADAQLPSGAFPDIAPRLNFPGAAAPAWGDAGVIVPWTVWKMYGDRGVPERHFGAMTAWMDFLARGNSGYLRTRELGHNYNDWLAPGNDDTPRELLATAYWAHDAALMAELAEATGRAEEAARYRELRAKIGAAFADEFVGADGQVASGTQTAYVLALHMGLVPDDLRAAAAGRLVAAIGAADWHLTTGFVGVGYLLPVLSAAGHTDVAYRLLAQRTFPSWRYMIDRGATTIWERWDGWSEEQGFQSAWMNSFNHYALGSVGEWLYRFVLGIDQVPGSAGFGRLRLRPHPHGSLNRANGSYQSARGPVLAGWERAGGRLDLPGRGPAERAGQRARAERRPRRGARLRRRLADRRSRITPGSWVRGRPSSRSGRGGTSSPGRTCGHQVAQDVSFHERTLLFLPVAGMDLPGGSPERKELGSPVYGRVVHIVGGGSRNDLLCQLTADAAGLPVLAGPAEATALGNVLVQGRALGAVQGSLAELRALLRACAEPRRFAPRGRSRAWDEAAARLLRQNSATVTRLSRKAIILRTRKFQFWKFLVMIGSPLSGW